VSPKTTPEQILEREAKAKKYGKVMNSQTQIQMNIVFDELADKILNGSWSLLPQSATCGKVKGRFHKGKIKIEIGS